jgi:xanthine dehydrogenase accessory factor
MNQRRFAEELTALVDRREPFVVATIVKTEGPTLGKPGFKVIMSQGGRVLYGTLGGGCPESVLVAPARKTIETGAPRTVKIYLESVEDAVGAVVKSVSEDEIHVETNCGGTMDVYIEPYLPQPRLILIGDGGKNDVEDVLVKLGKTLDYEVVVVDHLPLLTEEPDRLIKDPDFELSSFPFSGSDAVVVLTRGRMDAEVLQALSKYRLAYVGLMASSQRAKEDITKLREMGVEEKFIASLRSPVGADIGAVTPAEIALSVMTEVVAERHGKTVARKSIASGPGQPRIESKGL